MVGQYENVWRIVENGKGAEGRKQENILAFRIPG